LVKAGTPPIAAYSWSMLELKMVCSA
jgi:hypothetical protein